MSHYLKNEKDRQDCQQKLTGFKNLEKGWKGDGSIPPKLDTIGAAIIFLNLLYMNSGLGLGRDRIIKPSIGADADGDITFFWRTDIQFVMDLSIYEDATYSFYARDYQDQRMSGEYLKVTTNLPSLVIKNLKEVKE